MSKCSVNEIERIGYSYKNKSDKGYKIFFTRRYEMVIKRL